MATPEEHEEHNDATEKQILSDVEKHGFFMALFNSDGYSPSFAYTIGLYKTYGYPDFICFGLNLELMQSMFWTAKELFDKQPKPELNTGYPDFLEDCNVQFLPVDKNWYSDYFGYGHWFYKGWDFPAWQIVWPDKQALFPWDEGFNRDWRFKQPLLDRNTDFKFREERNVAVFTTREVLEGLPILRVFHDSNGDWGFLCGTTTDIFDMKVVSLEEITKIDSTVNELHELNYDWSAWRESVNDEWQREESEDEEKPEVVEE